MSTYEIVEAWKREQRQAGIQEGLHQAILGLYETRFGVLPEDLVAIVRAERDDATLSDWINLTGTGTADEVTARLRAHRAS